MDSTPGSENTGPLGNLDKDKERVNQWLEIKLLFCEKYFDFISYSEDYYIPKEIADKLRQLEAGFLIYPENIERSKYGKVGFASLANDNLKWGIPDNRQITLEEFTKKWIDLLETVKSWIQKHTYSKKSLNM